MRILFEDKEYQISGLNSGFNLYGAPKDVIVSGVPVCSGGKLCEGVEDITEYRTELDEDGNKIQVEVIPEVDIG